MTFSLEDVLKIVKTINIILQNDNFKRLTEEGVFRVSGIQSSIDEIIDCIISEKNNPERNLLEKTYSVHDFVGALKKAIRERESIKGVGASFTKIAQFTKKDQEKDLDFLFIILIKSQQLKQLYLAEIFYIYFQLATLASTFEKDNKMTASNLGIILGPSLCETDDLSILSVLNEFSAMVIGSKQYTPTLSFHQYIAKKYPDLKELLVQPREKEIQSTIIEISNIKNYIFSMNQIASQFKEQKEIFEEKVEIINKTLENLHIEAKEKRLNSKDVRSTSERLGKERQELFEKIRVVKEDLESHQKQYQTVKEEYFQCMQKLNRLNTMLEALKKDLGIETFFEQNSEISPSRMTSKPHKLIKKGASTTCLIQSEQKKKNNKNIPAMGKENDKKKLVLMQENDKKGPASEKEVAKINKPSFFRQYSTGKMSKYDQIKEKLEQELSKNNPNNFN